jgi:predicted nucleotidyltransferase
MRGGLGVKALFRMPSADLQPDVERALKRAVAVLDGAGIDFMIGGGLAGWAHGGPPTTGDVDLMLQASDARTAMETLGKAGMRTEEPPEQWLLKAYDEDVLIDLIYEPSGMRVDEEALARAEFMDVCAMRVKVMALEDVFATKLLALNDNQIDLGPLIKMARAVREKVDWAEVRRRTEDSPYARGFFALAAELGLGELA